MKNMIKIFATICICSFLLETFAFNMQISTESYSAYSKKQIKRKSRGSRIKIVTPSIRNFSKFV